MAQISLRVDDDVKHRAEQVLDDIGVIKNPITGENIYELSVDE